MNQIWAMRFALTTTIIVVILSWLNAVKITELFIRAGVSFGIMYFLITGSLSLFKWNAPQKRQNEQPRSDSKRGEFIDIAIGNDDELQIPQAHEPNFPGQLDSSLSAGLESRTSIKGGKS